MKNKNIHEVNTLLDNLASVEKNYREEKSRILWGLTRLTSKTEIAKRLDIDRKTLYKWLDK